jgi:parallel beta-helix repeat protein
VVGIAEPHGLPGIGISATGTVTGNYATGNAVGIDVGAGSTVIGNTATDNRGNPPFGASGIVANCRSNVTNNTAVNNSGQNLVLNGNGCNDTNNVAP